MHFPLIALSLAFGLACSRSPEHARVRRNTDLNTVMNTTVCPIRVQISRDPERVPQLIKELKCASNPLQHCLQMGVPEAECCHVNRDDQGQACVEVEDIAQVYFPAMDLWQPLRVSVGCTCVIYQIPEAGSVDPQ